jgi:hypothetical protein
MRPQLISRLGRHIWILKPNELFRGERHAIEWNSLLPTGLGTRHQRQYLTKSCKDLLMAMISAPRPTRGEEVSSGTVLNWFSILKGIVQWMISNGCWRFSELSSDLIESYITPCRKQNLSEITVKARFRMFEEMWSLRSSHSGSLRLDPNTLDCFQHRSAKPSTPWLPLPHQFHYL